MTKIKMLSDFSLNGRLLKKDALLEIHSRFDTKDISMGQAISLVNRKVAQDVEELKELVAPVSKKAVAKEEK